MGPRIECLERVSSFGGGRVRDLQKVSKNGSDPLIFIWKMQDSLWNELWVRYLPSSHLLFHRPNIRELLAAWSLVNKLPRSFSGVLLKYIIPYRCETSFEMEKRNRKNACVQPTELILFYRKIITDELHPTKANFPLLFTFIWPLLAQVCFFIGEKSTELFKWKYSRPLRWWAFLLLISLIFCWTNGFNFSSSFKEINNFYSKH